MHFHQSLIPVREVVRGVPGDIPDLPVRETAIVTVSEPVDGSRRRKKPRPARIAKVRTIKAHPMVWPTALELAGGDAERLTIDPKTGFVTVHNHRGAADAARSRTR